MCNLLLLLFGAVISSVLVSEGLATSSAERAVESLAVVTVATPAGPKSIGSAWAMKRGDGYRIYTAQHVGLVPLNLWACVNQDCIQLPRATGIGPIVSTALADDWMYWDVQELPAGMRVLKAGRAPSLGDEVCAVGAPLGRVGEYTCGAITNITDSYIFVDARVLPGNSGGPLLDASGRVIGLVVAIDVLQDESVVPTSGYVIPIASLGI